MTSLNEIELLERDIASINEVLGELPQTPEVRANIFQIAGFPSRELVISNMIAFYLSNDEHCFKRTMFDSLLNIIGRKTTLPQVEFNTEYSVEREENYIDIVVRSENAEDEEKETEWALVIENKIHASLYNNLPEYWQRVKSKHKIGVVLSLNDLTHELKKLPPDINFVSITHKELVDEWKKDLGYLFLSSDDRHLLYLKDYFENIFSHYKNQQMDSIKEEKLIKLQQHYEVLDRIAKAEAEVKQYVVEELNNIMRGFDFYPYTETWKANGKHFYATEKLLQKTAGLEEVRFFVYLPDLHKYSYLTVYFELFGKATRYGDYLRKKTAVSPIPNSLQLQQGTAGASNAGYCHLYVINDYWLEEEKGAKNFAAKLKQCLERNFFSEQTGIVWECAKWIEEAKAEEQKKAAQP